MAFALFVARPLSGGRRGGLRTTKRGVRSLVPVVRTIGPAEPCSRPRQVQRLVTADKTGPCPHAEGMAGGQATPTRVVPVRICRRCDLERACQPKLCDCPQRTAPRTVKQKLCSLAVFGSKGALSVGLVYWTMSEGIWGNTEDTENFYYRIRETIVSDPAVDKMTLPRLENMKFKILDSYNRAVLKIMGILVGVPLRMNKRIRDVLFPCEPEDDDVKK